MFEKFATTYMILNFIYLLYRYKQWFEKDYYQNRHKWTVIERHYSEHHDSKLEHCDVNMCASIVD